MESVRVDKPAASSATSQNREAAKPAKEFAQGTATETRNVPSSAKHSKPLSPLLGKVSKPVSPFHNASKPLSSFLPGKPKSLTNFLGQRANAKKEESKSEENQMPEKKGATASEEQGTDKTLNESSVSDKNSEMGSDTPQQEVHSNEANAVVNEPKEAEQTAEKEQQESDKETEAKQETITEKEAETDQSSATEKEGEKEPTEVKEQTAEQDQAQVKSEEKAAEKSEVSNSKEKGSDGNNESSNEKAESPTPSAEDEKKEEEEDKDAPKPMAADYDNPPEVKPPQTGGAVDKEGGEIPAEEEAEINVNGLVTVAQQFRDQGKETLGKAKEAQTINAGFESELKAAKKKIEASDKALGDAEKHVQHRTDKMETMDKALKTSEDRQQKVASEVGTYKSEVHKNKPTANKLKKETGSLVSGSKKYEDPSEPDTGALSRKTNELGSGADTIAEGIGGAGDTTSKLASGTKDAKKKNDKTRNDIKDTKQKLNKSKNKVDTEQKKNKASKDKVGSTGPKVTESKKQTQNLEQEGKGLIDASYSIENDVNSIQYTYYKDMSKVEGKNELAQGEEAFMEQQLAEENPLLSEYISIHGEDERVAFFQKLNPEQKAQLMASVKMLGDNSEEWIEEKQALFNEKVEKKYAWKILKVDESRNKALNKPLATVDKNFGRVSKAGLFWSSLTGSIKGIWTSITSIGWADVGKGLLSMLNPTQAFVTIFEGVKGIWTDLSDWGGFSKDPVGMILQKSARTAISLLTISGAITGLLLVLTVIAAVLAAFTGGIFLGLAFWLGNATVTMGTVTFWLGAITLGLNVLSGIKNIFDVHDAKTAKELFKNNAELKENTSNAFQGLMGMAGGKAAAPNVKTIMSSARNPKTLIKGFAGGVKSQIRSFPGKVKSVNKFFKKDTWKGMYKKLTTLSKKETPGDTKLTMDRPQGHHPAAHIGTTPETHGKGRDEKMEEAATPKSKETTNKKQQEPVHIEKDPEIDELKKHEGNVDESAKKKMKEDADEDIPDGPNADVKRKALFAAKVITKSNDKANSPLALLMTELEALRKIFKGVPPFKAKSLKPNVWQISMNPPVDVFDNSMGQESSKDDKNDDKNNKEQSKNRDESFEKEGSLDGSIEGLNLEGSYRFDYDSADFTVDFIRNFTGIKGFGMTSITQKFEKMAKAAGFKDVRIIFTTVVNPELRTSADWAAKYGYKFEFVPADGPGTVIWSKTLK